MSRESAQQGEGAMPGVTGKEPMPTKSDRPAIQDLVAEDCVDKAVAADIIARKEIGLQRYGTYLQAFNGRDALLDAYQEALDLAIYLRQVIAEEREKQQNGDCSIIVDWQDYHEVLGLLESLRRRLDARPV